MTMKAIWMMTMEEMAKEPSDAEAGRSVAMLREFTSPALNISGSSIALQEQGDSPRSWCVQLTALHEIRAKTELCF